mgnify:CR=1 FL=1
MNYERANKIKKYERRIGFIKRYVYLQKDIDNLLKNKLRITVSKKQIQNENLITKNKFIKIFEDKN